MLWTHEAQRNIILDKSTDNAEPNLIYFLPQYSTSNKIPPYLQCISERDQDGDANRDQALSITSCNMIGLFPKMSIFDWLYNCVTL